MSVITKTIIAAAIRPSVSSETPRKILSPTYTISRRARKWLVLALPAWYLSWQLAPLLPEALKPDIDVLSLIKLEEAMFGYLPHKALEQNFRFEVNGFPLTDVLMAIPYTLHVFWPLSFLAFCAKTRRWGMMISFVNCFGLASLAAVLTELICPTAPPWYLENFGIAPADYSMPGNPGGLTRIDSYFGGKFYDSTFSKSPLVFGAFPSLHVGWPTLLSLFIVHANAICNDQRFKVGVICYFIWVCFAVVYLQHHYVIDVIGGIAYSAIAFHFAGPHRDAVPTVKLTTKTN